MRADDGKESVSRNAAESAFAAALELEKENRLEEAVRAFQSIPSEYPESRRTAESLFRAASLLDGSLGSYPAALDLYGRIVSSYPGTRFAERARQRHEYLERNALPDEAAFRAYEQAIQRRVRREAGGEETRRALLAVVDERPASPVAPMAVLALARELEKGRDRAGARRRYQEILDRYPRAEAAIDARRELGDLAFSEGRYEEALDHYARLASMGGPAWREAAGRLTQRVQVHIFRRRIFRLSAAVMFLFTLAVAWGTSWRTVRLRGVKWPWAELLTLAVFTSPFLALVHGMGGTLFRAVLCEVGASAAILVLIALRLSAPLSGGSGWKILFTLSALFAVAAAGYAVLYLFDLTFLVDRISSPL